MGSLRAADGTRLAYHRSGTGDPLVCLPGGPMQASACLGDLGGLTGHRTLVRLDLRGTGESEVPADPATYRCDRQVGDVEALRDHLGLDRMDLLAHSAGAALAVRYAAAHPDRVARLVLVAPSPAPVGLDITDADRREAAEPRRAGFPDAWAAFQRIWSGSATEADWSAIEPFKHGRWDADTRARVAREAALQNTDAAAIYYSDGALDPAGTRAAVAALPAPVLLVAGEYDVGLPPKRATEYAGLFRHGQVTVVPGGAHFPWHDDPEFFTRTVAGFLR